MHTNKVTTIYNSAVVLNILIMMLFVQIKALSVSGASGVPNGEVLASKSFPLMAEEPTCEQLRAMWIFSKRQSRAAELTNEIPTYRDPFAYNVWNPYYALNRNTGRTVMDGLQMVTSRHGSNSRSPVFGRIINQEPVIPTSMISGPKSASGNINKVGVMNGTKRPITTSYRYVGGSPSSSPSGQLSTTMTNPNGLAVQGSFHKLKELIWTERAKELTQQRRLEEMAARAAVLKEIANGQNVQSLYKQQGPSDSMLMDENRSPESDYIENGRSFMPHKSQQMQPQNTKSERHTIMHNIGGTPNRNGGGGGAGGGTINHHKFNRGGFGSGARFQQQRMLPAYLRQQQQQQQQLQSFDDFDDNLNKDSDLTSQTASPRWRNSAGIVQKYPRPRGGSHFRERQRALIGKVPAENKFYQRTARNYDSPSNYNNKQIILLHEILEILNNNNNNNEDQEQQELIDIPNNNNENNNDEYLMSIDNNLIM